LSSIRCFKAYDLRGRIPDELNEEVVYRVARGYAEFVAPARVVVGRDIRLSSPSLCDALCRGLNDSGVDVDDIGVCGTEGVYFATFDGRYEGGIMVTASHNPPDYNGMKFVREQSRPISADTGLKEIRACAERGAFRDAPKPGVRRSIDVTAAYVEHLLSYVEVKKLERLKIVVNAGNGAAGPILDRLEPHLPFELIKIHHEPDGRFPNGVPNPMLEGNRAPTVAAIRARGADLGLAWDGDFDRCFFFDEHEPPGGRIVHDPRLTWNTQEIVAAQGGQSVLSKSGHAFIKQRMREVDGVYGGEMSAHHYFRRFAYCDSGMIPWLLIAQIISESKKPLSKLVGERIAKFPVSGELNYRVPDAAAAMAAVEARYAKEARSSDRTDGLSLEFADWRFNLRSSNTEPLIRLNVEARGSQDLMRSRTLELFGVLKSQGAVAADT
jgi:phosphomannomutase